MLQQADGRYYEHDLRDEHEPLLQDGVARVNEVHNGLGDGALKHGSRMLAMLRWVTWDKPDLEKITAEERAVFLARQGASGDRV